MEASLSPALPTSDSSSDADKPPRTRSWLRAMKRLFSSIVPRKIIKHRRRLRRKMPSGWNHPSELGVSRRQAGGPTKGRLPPADSHRDPDESQQEDDGPTIHPGMEATSVSEEFPIQEYLERHSVNVSILETGGRIRRCVSSSTISTVSPGIYSPASPPPGVDSTNATTPHRETEEPRQLSEDEPSRNSSPKNRSQAALSLVSTNSEYYYIDPVFVVTNDNQDKEGALMALAAKSSFLCKVDRTLWSGSKRTAEFVKSHGISQAVKGPTCPTFWLRI